MLPKNQLSPANRIAEGANNVARALLPALLPAVSGTHPDTLPRYEEKEA